MATSAQSTRSEQHTPQQGGETLRRCITGLFSFLPNEDPAQYEALVAGLREEHQPTTLTENLLIEKLAQHFWLQQRANRLADLAKDDKQFSVFTRFHATHDRAFHKCLDQLAKLRAERRKNEIGFESQKHKQAEEARKQELHEARVRLTNPKAKQVEIESDIKQTIEAPLPGHMRIPFDALKDTFKLAVDEANRQLKTQAAA